MSETNVRYSDASQPAEAEGAEVVGHLLVGAVGGNAIDISLNNIVDCQRRYGGEIVGVMTVVQHQNALSAVTAENDRLRARIAELESGTVDPADVCALGQERDKLRAEVERLHKTFDDMCRKAAYWADKAAELERDAARYRFLRDKKSTPGVVSSNSLADKYFNEYILRGEQMDIAIDAELDAKEGDV